MLVKKGYSRSARGYFKLNPTTLKFGDALTECQSAGAHLPILKRQADITYLRSITPDGFWLGKRESVHNTEQTPDHLF